MNRNLLEMLYGLHRDACEEIARLRAIEDYPADDPGALAADVARLAAYNGEANRLHSIINAYWEAHGG